jgi:hypothetical protein
MLMDEIVEDSEELLLIEEAAGRTMNGASLPAA